MTTDEFIQERIYLKGVSSLTVEWYKCSFRAFDGAMGTKQTILARIAEIKNRGTSNITINSYLRCVNAYLMWQHKEHGRDLLRIPKLKEEQKVLATLGNDGIAKIVRFRPPAGDANVIRVHLVAMVILDTGLRISEVLRLTTSDINFDQMILRVHGKGNKQRIVPFSQELRKVLYRYAR